MNVRNNILLVAGSITAIVLAYYIGGRINIESFVTIIFSFLFLALLIIYAGIVRSTATLNTFRAYVASLIINGVSLFIIVEGFSLFVVLHGILPFFIIPMLSLFAGISYRLVFGHNTVSTLAVLSSILFAVWILYEYLLFGSWRFLELESTTFFIIRVVLLLFSAFCLKLAIEVWLAKLLLQRGKAYETVVFANLGLLVILLPAGFGICALLVGSYMWFR